MPFIPLEVFANNPSTTVSSGGTTAPASGTVETWTVASSASFPAVDQGATQFHVADPALPSEMITVQAVSGTTWTVQRGAELSAPVAHAGGFTVVQVVTAGALAHLAYPPWQFPVQAYGAQGDGKIGTGGTGASGQAVLTDAGASFVNAAAPAGDVGKVIIVNQGTGSSTSATNPFVGTILSVNSSTSITLSANLAATCTAAPYVFGTDDANDINAAVLAAAQWAVSTGNYKAQVVFEPQLYMLGALIQSTTYGFSPFNTGVNYTYNTHIAVPFTTQYARKLVIDFIGTGDSSDPDFWGSAIPSIQGSCLVSAVFPPSQPDATFGQMSVIGTPASPTNIGTGGISSANFGNVLINVNGMSVVTPYNGQQYGYDFRYAAQANIQNAAAVAFAPVNFNSQTAGGTWLSHNTIPSNGVAVGLAMPVAVNNDNCNVGLFVAEAWPIGILISEHFTAQRVCTIYCSTGIRVTWQQAGTLIHGGSILYWSCEGGNWGLDTGGEGTSGQYNLEVGHVDFEQMNTGYINDAGACLTGKMSWHALDVWTPSGAGLVAANYRVINNRMTRGIWVANASYSIPAPSAAPASGTANAQQNIAYRDATVYASATTGITNTSIGPASGSQTALGQTAGNNVAIPIRVPSGYWYSVTYTGTLTVTWVMD